MTAAMVDRTGLPNGTTVGCQISWMEQRVELNERYTWICCFFFFKQKTAYDVTRWLDFRRVLFRSHYECAGWRLNDDVSAQGRSTRVIQHIRSVARSWVETSDLEIPVTVAGNAPLLT